MKRKDTRTTAPARSVRGVAGGLFQALHEAGRGNDGPIFRWWCGGGGPEIKRVLRHHGLDRWEAEDAAQLVVIEVLSAITHGKSVHSERTWLAKLIRNLAVNMLRERSRHPRPCSTDPDSLPSRDDFTRASDRRIDFRHAILLVRSMPRPYAQIAQAQFMFDMTRDQIREFLQTWSGRSGQCRARALAHSGDPQAYGQWDATRL